MPCTLSSNSTMVGAASVYTVQFTPSVIIEAGSVVQLQFDSWGTVFEIKFPYNKYDKCMFRSVYIELVNKFSSITRDIFIIISNILKLINNNHPQQCSKPIFILPIKVKDTYFSK